MSFKVLRSYKPMDVLPLQPLRWSWPCTLSTNCMTRVYTKIWVTYSLSCSSSSLLRWETSGFLFLSVKKKKQQQINARKKDSAEAKEAVGASSDLQALSPSRSRRSSRPRVLSPGARTTREPFGPPGMRRSWRTTIDNTASGAICRSAVSGTKRRRVLWLNPFWLRWLASTTLRGSDSWI